jgi:[ribosomal protein S5]-alanine N-acetyltransferase
MIFDDFPQLETENLRLRQMTFSDTKAIFDFFSNAEVLKYHDVEAFTSFEQAERLINRWNRRFYNEQGIRWGIAKKDDDIIIGSCGYSQWNKKPSQAEIGYELSKVHWRKGIMTEALRAAIKFGFESLKFHRIEATVMLENAASMKLLQKLGFVEEGILQDYGFWKCQFHDLKLFSLLKKDDNATKIV